jgi:ferric-dicitrate binding protein FerR (iron transport regulator)
MNSKQQQLEKAEHAWYRAKARAEQAVDRVSDCERKVTRLREELDCKEIPGNTPVQIGRRKKMAKKLKGILIEVNGGVVSYVQFNGKPVTAYHLFDWDELLGDSDTRRAWEGLSTEEQEFIRDRYPIEFAAIQERLKEEA